LHLPSPPPRTLWIEPCITPLLRKRLTHTPPCYSIVEPAISLCHCLSTAFNLSPTSCTICESLFSLNKSHSCSFPFLLLSRIVAVYGMRPSIACRHYITLVLVISTAPHLFQICLATFHCKKAREKQGKRKMAVGESSGGSAER
jgi:hypothetical protein